MLYEVFVTRTTMYEVFAPDKEAAIDIARAGDAVQVGQVTGDAWAEPKP